MQRVLKWIFMVMGIFLLAACGESHSSSTISNLSNNNFNFGLSSFNSTREFLVTQNNGVVKALALDEHREHFISSLNSIAKGTDVTQPIQKRSIAIQGNKDILNALFGLIDDDTLPDMTDALGQILNELARNPENLKALSEFSQTKVGVEYRNFVALLRKIFLHPQCQEIANAVDRLIETNPDFLKNILATFSSTLSSLPSPELTQIILDLLATDMKDLSSDDSSQDRAVWLVRLDSQNNPKVLKDGFGYLYPPFVDADWNGECDVDHLGRPIDKYGKVIQLEAFGKNGYQDGKGKWLVTRDQEGKAVSSEGKLVFEYFDAQKTVLSAFLYNLGRAIELDILHDFHQANFVALKPMKQFEDEDGPYWGYSDEGDLVKGSLSALSLLKKDDFRDFLRVIQKVFEKDPLKAEKVLKALGQVMVSLRDNNFSSPAEIAEILPSIFEKPSSPEVAEMMEILRNTHIHLGFTDGASLWKKCIRKNKTFLAEEILWPWRNSLITIQKSYPSNPEIFPRVYNNILGLVCGSALEKYKLTPVVPTVITLLLTALDLDPEGMVDMFQESLKESVTSRHTTLTMECWKKFLSLEESHLIQKGVATLLTPQEDEEINSYSEIVRLGIALVQCNHDVKLKIRLANMVAKLLDPKRPIVSNLIDSLGSLLGCRDGAFMVKTLRVTFCQCHKFQLSPMTMLSWTFLDVLQAGGKHYKKGGLSEEDIHKVCHGLSHGLTNPSGYLKKIYKLVKERKR